MSFSLKSIFLDYVFDNDRHHGQNHFYFYSFNISNTCLKSNCYGMRGCNPLPIGEGYRWLADPEANSLL